MRLPIPLSRRPLDIALLAFFAVNLCFTTYGVSLEQIAIDNPFHFTPPLWPPLPLVELVHWWERSFDPLLLARPAWYRATIWLDVLAFGPFYAVAIYAFARGRDWIRIPAILWASALFTCVLVILFDELEGTHATPYPAPVLSANAPWLLVPVLAVWRLARSEHPFTEERPGAGAAAAPPASGFRERYGPWALVAGASAGLGAAFARLLGARGLNLLLLARRQNALERLAAEVRAAHGVEVRVAAVDLARADLAEVVTGLGAGLEIGLLVYNAAHSAIGPFVDRPLEEHLRVLEVNCRGPLVLSHSLGGAMARRGRGGIVIMTSVAGSQGNPLLASYAASKGFDLVLAEGLWAELRLRGVDVVACRAGATRTPGYAASLPRRSVPLMEPEDVARRALEALGRGPSAVAGVLNRVAAFALGRILPRTAAIRIMGRATRRLYE